MKKSTLIFIILFIAGAISAQEEHINLELKESLSGTYDYRAKESIILKPGFEYKPSSSTESFRASIDPMIVEMPDSENTYGGSDNGIVGLTEGSMEVTPSGAATYSIPIKIPPGTGGLAPQLSIVYNSQRADGLLGTGFSVEGLSVISRCSSTLEDDGRVDGVDFDNLDRFSLDGNRLITIKGAYGANETEYRTANNSFSRIISYSSGSTGPDKFEVYTKSGLIYEYGATNNARFKPKGSDYTISWLVNKVRDTKGNYYIVTYVQDSSNGEYRPSRIDYTGNSTSSPVLTPYASVRFEYSRRSATQNIYVNGFGSKISKRLSKIRAYYGETVVKTYQLGYKSGKFGKYMLSSITEIGKNGRKYNPTKFTWYANDSYKHTEQIYDKSYYAAKYVYKSDITLGDFNGDGQTDFIATPKSNASFTGWRLFIANAEGSKCSYQGTGTLLEGFEKLFAGDFNGDGKTDIIQCRKYGKYRNYWVQYSTGNGFSSKSGPAFFTEDEDHGIRIGDFNGDGISDVFVYYPRKRICKIIRSGFRGGKVIPFDYTATRYLPAEKEWDRVEICDFNGDGLTDVMNLDDDGYQLLESDGYGTMSVARNLSWPQKDHHLNFGDFNGDGKTDMLITGWKDYNWSNWQIHLSTGIEFEKSTFSKKFESSEKRIFVGDINGDGRDDFFAINRSGSVSSLDDLDKIPLYISNTAGTYFYYQEGDRAYTLSQWDFYTGDFNGDGRLDYFYTSAEDKWTGYQLYTASTARDNLLENVTDGFGNVTSLSYKSVTNNDIYTKNSDAIYPLTDLEGAFVVVASLTRPNGNGGKSVTNYKYEGAKLHKRGKGFLGFSKFSATNMQTGITKTSEYEIEPSKYITGLKRTETRISKGNYSNKLLSETIYTNILKNYERSGIYTFMPSEVVEKNYKLNASSVYKKTTSTYTYDDYGNVLSTIQCFKNPSGSNDESSITVTNVYSDDVSNWILGRLTQATSVKRAEGQNDVTRVSEFRYSDSGLLIREIVEPGNAELSYEKIYEHDDYGNIVKSTTKADGESVTAISVYDTKGRFETSSYNALEHITSKAISPYFGSVTRITDANKLTSTTEYDGFGRATKSVDASGLRTIVAYRWCNEGEGGPSNALYYVHTESSDAPPAIEFFDSLGRSVRKITTGFDGTKILEDTQYDDLGHILHTSDPYFEGGEAHFTTFYYDDLGRITRKFLPDGSEINITYNGLTTTTQDPLGQKNTRTVNQQGLLVNSKDANNKSITYKYDSAGNLIETRDPAGNVVKMEYDILGNRIKLIDPDLGTIVSNYNAFGELVSEIDAKGQKVEMEYDKLGRMISRTEKEGVSTWEYDTSSNGIGKLSSSSGHNGVQQSFAYDDLGRIVRQTETIDNISYNIYTAYDAYSRVSKVTYPADPSNSLPLVVKNEYNKYNYLKKVKNASSGKIYWTAGKINARGQLEEYEYGNGMHSTREYNNLTGMLSGIKTKNSSDLWIQNWSYIFNDIGNLIQRKDVKRALTEVFEYDKLNRLIKTKVNGVDDVFVSYDDLGNIIFKSDVGTYNYNDPGGVTPHAVQSISTVKGNILKTSTQNITYNSFDKIASIAQGTDSLTFIYGLSHERKRVDTYKNKELIRQKYYVGNLYEKEKDITTGEIKETCYIFAGGSAIAIYNHSSNEGDNTMYLLKDHLGSMQCVADEDGDCIQELSYDAWGNRRDPNTWEVYSTLPTGTLLTRGYTGHEHMDLVDLVNMNGRLYDPAIGRFLSPDPLVQAPGNLQSYNRYSYCLNNPLSLTDPSGYSWLSRNWKSLTAAVVAITVTVVTAGTGSGIGVAIMSGAAGGFAGGVTGAVLTGASLGQTFKAGVVGGVIGGASGFLSFASGGVSAQSSVGSMLERAGKHAFSNAWLNGITGGNMKHGLITGALSSMGNGLINTKLDSRALKVGASAVLGGTIDEIGGGKFANGAITSAYGMMFNELQHDLKREKAANSGGGRPSFDDMVNNYPGTQSSGDVYNLIGGKVYQNYVSDPVKYANSCALRMSRALNYSGAEIPFIKGQTGSGSDGKWYFYRVSDLCNYISNRLGWTVDMTGSSAAVFANKKGIMLFQDCGWSNATGHLDLWDGNGCGNHCYWNQCNNASLWVLP